MNEKNAIDINFAAVGHALLRRLWLLVVVAILCAGVAYAYVSLRVTPLYSSDAAMYIGDTGDGLGGSNVTISNVLTDDYRDIITRRTVLESVISELGLNMSSGGLKSCISVTNPNGTRMLVVKVTTSDPELSKTIVDKVCEVSAVRIKEIVKLDYVTLIDDGRVSSTPVNINKPFSMTMAAIVGVLVTAFVIVVRVLLDDKIRTSEDVERYLGLSVLGSIPRMESDKTSSPQSAK